MALHCRTVAALLLAAATVSAQTTGGAIRGRVIDPQGRPIAGVSVTAVYRPIDFSRLTTTDTAGHFFFFALPAGTYEVSAERSGYGAITTRKIEVELGATRTLTVKLKKSEVEESVTVTAPASMIQTGIALGTSVSTTLIRELPLVQRSVSEIATFTPGTLLLVPPDSARFSVSVNQQRALHLFDGAEGELALDIDALIGVATEQPQLGPEFGRTLGGVILVATRSGSDQYDGDLHELFHGHPRQHQFGGSAGGPVVRDRAFFFASAERRLQGSTPLEGASNQTTAIAGLSGIWTTHAARLRYLSDSSARQNLFVAGDNWQVRDHLWNDFVFQKTSQIADAVTFTRSDGPLSQNVRAGADYARKRSAGIFGSDELVWSKLLISAGARLSRWDGFDVRANATSMAIGASHPADPILQSVTDRSRRTTTLEPRLGFSYDVNGSGRNILRAGIGRYYAQTLPSNALLRGIANGDVISSTLSVPFSDIASAGYAYQVNPWFSLNANASHVDYRRLPFRFRANPINPATGLRRIPSAGDFGLWYGRGRARYDAISTGARARLGDRFELEGFYAYSRSWGNVQSADDESVNPLDPLCRECFGPLNNDARHRVSVAAVVRLPDRITLAGVVRYRSANPYTDFSGTDLNGDGYGFDLPAGVSHVNGLRGSRFSQTDLRVAKSFWIKEDKRDVELILDLFNIFNEKNAAGYRGSRADPAYGTPSVVAGDFAERPRRLAEIGLRMTF